MGKRRAGGEGLDHVGRLGGPVGRPAPARHDKRGRREKVTGKTKKEALDKLRSCASASRIVGHCRSDDREAVP